MIDLNITYTLPAINADVGPVMEEVSNIMLDSVRQNFGAGGRPKKWVQKADGTPSFLFGAPDVPKTVGKSGYKKYGKAITREGGALLRSIFNTWGSNFAEVSTSGIIYAWIHQAGGKAGRNHASFIPQRIYMLFQKDDEKRIIDLITDFIIKGKK